MDAFDEDYFGVTSIDVLFKMKHLLCSTYISALERQYLNTLYSIHRFIGMIFRNE